VAQRAHEIALRMALGATRNGVVGLIIRDGVVLAAIGLGLGLIGAYFVGRAMQSLQFGIQALDFAAFLSVAIVLLAAAILACSCLQGERRLFRPCVSSGQNSAEMRSRPFRSSGQTSEGHRPGSGRA
jgi:predicted lysophospholipase L1 biosynthesis ABC-type transport system permease subunit